MKERISPANQIHEYFLLEVTKLEINWPEKAKRERKAMKLLDAINLLQTQTRRRDRIVQVQALKIFQANLLN